MDKPRRWLQKVGGFCVLTLKTKKAINFPPIYLDGSEKLSIFADHRENVPFRY